MGDDNHSFCRWKIALSSLLSDWTALRASYIINLGELLITCDLLNKPWPSFDLNSIAFYAARGPPFWTKPRLVSFKPYNHFVPSFEKISDANKIFSPIQNWYFFEELNSTLWILSENVEIDEKFLML